jgi:hypothetical protein
MKKLIGIVFALAVFLTACSTTPKVDWQSRVGGYSFDQAVVELGPPDKDAKLTDGTRVCEWLTSHGHGGGAWITPMRGGWTQTIDNPSPDYFLRLTFDANGTLRSWKKFAK